MKVNRNDRPSKAKGTLMKSEKVVVLGKRRAFAGSPMVVDKFSFLASVDK